MKRISNDNMNVVDDSVLDAASGGINVDRHTIAKDDFYFSDSDKKLINKNNYNVELHKAYTRKDLKDLGIIDASDDTEATIQLMKLGFEVYDM